MHGRACARMYMRALVRPHMYSESCVHVYVRKRAPVFMRLCIDGNSGHDAGGRGGGRWEEKCPGVWWRRGFQDYVKGYSIPLDRARTDLGSVDPWQRTPVGME